MTATEKNRFLSNRNLASEIGKRFYDKLYRDEYEVLYPGKYVSIDVETGKAGVGSTLTQAIDAVQKVAPEGYFYSFRIGHPITYRR